MAVFKELLSVAASVFVNYFAIFEGANFHKSVSFSKSRDVNWKKKTLDDNKWWKSMLNSEPQTYVKFPMSEHCLRYKRVSIEK